MANLVKNDLIWVITKKLKVNLVKDGLVWADETPFQHLLLPIRVCHGVTDMEQLIRGEHFYPSIAIL